MDVRQKLKRIIVEELNLEDIHPGDIDNNAPLFGEGGLGLDSLDAVELAVLLEKHFGVAIKDMAKGREVFRSIDTLANYVEANAVA